MRWSMLKIIAIAIVAATFIFIAAVVFSGITYK